MNQAQLAWSFLSESIGSFEGRGVNHEGQNYTGSMKIQLEMADKLLSLTSSAVGDQGEVFHKEVSWIGFDISGALTLYVTSNNHPGVTPHVFNRLEEKSDEKSVIFRFGDPTNTMSFREEITLSIHRDGSASYYYAWGLPGGEFKARSGSRMVKK